MIAAALSAFFTGLGINRVVMVVDLSANVMNGVLDYGLIFGHFGLPALGIEGAGWATVTSLWFRVVAYAAWMMLPRYRRPYQLGMPAGGPPCSFACSATVVPVVCKCWSTSPVSPYSCCWSARLGRKPWRPPRWPST